PTASIGPPSRSWPPTPANKRSSKFSGASRKATGSTGNPCITGPTARSACTLFTACWVSPCCTTFAAKPRPSGPRSPSKICRKSWSKSNSSYSCIPPRVRVLIEPPPWSPPRASSKKAWPKPWACNNSVVPHVGNTAVSWQLNEKSATSRSFWRVRSKLPLGVRVNFPHKKRLHPFEPLGSGGKQADSGQSRTHSRNENRRPEMPLGPEYQPGNYGRRYACQAGERVQVSDGPPDQVLRRHVLRDRPVV